MTKPVKQIQLIEAFEAVINAAYNTLPAAQPDDPGPNSGEFYDRVARVEDFFTNYWEELEEKYGDQVACEPDVDLSELREMEVDPANPLHEGILTTIELAAQDIGDDVSLQESVNATGIFWIQNGVEICAQTKTYVVDPE